jgi:CBS domain-containing protein
MRVGEILVKQDYIGESLLKDALAVQDANHHRTSIGQILINMQAVSEARLDEALHFQKSLELDSLENKQDFLRRISPFNLLSDEQLDWIGQGMRWEGFQPEKIILARGATDPNFYVIKAGFIKVYVEKEGEEVLLAFLGEGECFGETSLLPNATAGTVKALEYTLCLVQPKEAFLSMVREHPVFQTFFDQLITQRVRRIYNEVLEMGTYPIRVKTFPYKEQIKNLFPAQPFSCHYKTTVREAARDLYARNANVLLVVDDDTRPKGILEANEVLRAVVVEHADPGQTIERLVSEKYNVVDADDYLFDVIYQMVKHKTDHIVVVDRERAVGVITGSDLLKFESREILSLLKNIDGAPSIDDLRPMRSQVDRTLKTFMAERTPASQVCRIASELNDKIVRKVVALVEGQSGGAPAPYAWLGLGSEGRREQTLATDQDNALIFSSALPVATEYFRHFSEKVVNGLAQVGYPLCKGNIMATNPEYRGDITEWKRKLSQWATGSGVQRELVDQYVFFDFRAICGSATLAAELRRWLFNLIEERPMFLGILAAPIVSIPIPLGFFKGFVVEKNGKYKNTINIKTFGLLPLTTCIKLLALKERIEETNTLARITALHREGILSASQAELAEYAFETFLALKIKTNLVEKEQGREMSNRVDPDGLSIKEKQLLKEAFLTVANLQGTTRQRLNVEEN